MRGKNGFKVGGTFLVIEGKMVETQPVRCQKCGKPVGDITVLVQGFMGLQQPLQNAKVVAICMDCSQQKK
jgi:DNA-directed RNA polymerase subunit RPC12/RpoP